MSNIISISTVEAHLRTMGIPVTSKRAKLYGTPRVIVDDTTLQHTLDTWGIDFRDAGLEIEAREVAQVLARSCGYAERVVPQGHVRTWYWTAQCIWCTKPVTELLVDAKGAQHCVCDLNCEG